jgi:hypothetical protein
MGSLETAIANEVTRLAPNAGAFTSCRKCCVLATLFLS